MDNAKVKEYSVKIAYSCFGEFVKNHESCKTCEYAEICEMIFVNISQTIKHEKELDEAIQLLKERHGVWYKKDCAHIFDIPRCMCRKCIIERCDKMIVGKEKCW